MTETQAILEAAQTIAHAIDRQTDVVAAAILHSGLTTYEAAKEVHLIRNAFIHQHKEHEHGNT